MVALLNGGKYSTAELADLFGVPALPFTGRWRGSGRASAGARTIVA